MGILKRLTFVDFEAHAKLIHVLTEFLEHRQSMSVVQVRIVVFPTQEPG